MEKGLKTLQAAGRTASRRERNASHSALPSISDVEAEEINPYSDCIIQQSSKSRPHSEDNFNDSAIGQEGEHPFTFGGPSARSSPPSSNQILSQYHHPYPTPTGGHSPQFPPPLRTYSNASDMSSMGLTPTITAAPPFPSQLSLANPSVQFPSQRRSSGGGQQLPSFNDAFGLQRLP